jgi:hypothetical protein
MTEPLDHGPPTSYLALRRGTPVLASDGARIGRVRRVLAARAQDVFHGLLVDTDAGDRVIGADLVAALRERAVVLRVDAAACRDLPPRRADPAARPDTMLQALDDVTADVWRWASRRRGAS